MRDELGEGRVLRQELASPLEGRHVVVFPDRHVLVEVADQGVPPADHPAPRLAEQGEPRLFDEPVVCRPLVGLDPDPPLTVNPGRITPRRWIRRCRAIVAARRRDKDGQHKQKPRCSPDCYHVWKPIYLNMNDIKFLHARISLTTWPKHVGQAIVSTAVAEGQRLSLLGRARRSPQRAGGTGGGGPARDPDRQDLSVGPGGRRLPGPRTAAHPGQNRARTLRTQTARPGLGDRSPVRRGTTDDPVCKSGVRPFSVFRRGYVQ